MKLPAFDYLRAESVDAVFDALAREGTEARILAGGQSLVAALNFRLSEPALLIDINGLPAWDSIEKIGTRIRVGALVRHRQLLADAIIRQHLPLLAQAAAHIAHPAIRNRGTIGGSVALADPAAELPACCVALDATIIAQSARGERHLAADTFFTGLYETALAGDEVIRAIEFPAQEPVAGWHYFEEITRRTGDYAMAGVAICGSEPSQSPQSRPQPLRIVWFGLSDRPVRARAAEQGFAERVVTASTRWLSDVDSWRASATQDIDVFGDLQAGESMKRHLAAVLLHRAACRFGERGRQ